MFRYIAPALLCVFAIGCGSEKGPTLAPADGTVTYQGQPLADANVMFVPEKGPLATGITDSDGHFTLATGARSGVAVGPAKVAIDAHSPEESSVAAPPKPKNAQEAQEYVRKLGDMQTQMNQQGGPPQPKSLIPQQFTKVETSGLSYEVKAKGGNHFDIKLD